MTLVQWIDRLCYRTFESHWDDALFRTVILNHLKPNMHVMDIGAGAGIISQMNFRGKASKICGLDPDERVTANPFLDEGRQGVGEAIPYNDNAFDLIFADNVLEHLEAPQAVFQEVARVLKPGGLFLGKTPNRWHYVPLVARITPISFHRWLNRWRGRKEIDTFPTCYHANTRSDLNRLALKAGLLVDSITMVEGRPEYLRLSGITYLFGLIYERLVNAFRSFEMFRVVIIVVLRKPHEASPTIA